MYKKLIVINAVLTLMGGAMVGAAEAQPAGQVVEGQTVKKQTVCPIMGGQVDPSIYVDANGKRVYFCCNGCPATFKKDPAKYIGKMESAGITLDKTPAGDQTKDKTTAAVANSAKGMDHSAMKGGCCD